MQVIKKLQQQWPGLEITIEQIRTTGDRVIDKPLSQIGGDGVFVTEIEHALHEKRIDIAVHSLKDLPTMQPADLRLVIVGPREDVRDVFVSNEPGIQLGANMRVGTCSLRRMAQIRALYPAVQILPIRGNVDTRLRKLDAGEYDCILLAAAGLHRLDMQERLAGRITYLPIEAVMPAPGQGALALEIRDEPALYDELLAPLNDPAVQVATAAERMFMRHLGAGCYLPVAAYGRLHAQELTLHGLVISLDGQDLVRVQQSVAWTTASTLEHAEQLGIAVAEQALAQGAMEIIGVLNANREQEQQYA
jgi:hydroxymethylbilane synthase